MGSIMMSIAKDIDYKLAIDCKMLDFSYFRIYM